MKSEGGLVVKKSVDAFLYIFSCPFSKLYPLILLPQRHQRVAPALGVWTRDLRLLLRSAFLERNCQQTDVAEMNNIAICRQPSSQFVNGRRLSDATL